MLVATFDYPKLSKCQNVYTNCWSYGFFRPAGGISQPFLFGYAGEEGEMPALIMVQY